MRRALTVVLVAYSVSGAWASPADLTDTPEVVHSIHHNASGTTDIVIRDSRPRRKKPAPTAAAPVDFREVDVVAPGPSLHAAAGYAPPPATYAAPEPSRAPTAVINYTGGFAPGPSGGYAANRNPSYGVSVLPTYPTYGYGYGDGFYGYGYGYYPYAGSYRGYTSASYQNVLLRQRAANQPVYRPVSPTAGAVQALPPHFSTGG